MFSASSGAPTIRCRARCPRCASRACGDRGRSPRTRPAPPAVMASITRTPSLVPSIIDVSSAPKHAGQARTREPPASITNTAVAATVAHRACRRVAKRVIAASSSCAGTTSRRRPGRPTRRTPRRPRSGVRPRRPVRPGSRHQIPNSTASAAERRIRSAWNAPEVHSGIQKPLPWVSTGSAISAHEEGDGQHEDRDDQLLLGDQVHEVARHQRSLDGRDEQAPRPPPSAPAGGCGRSPPSRWSGPSARRRR